MPAAVRDHCRQIGANGFAAGAAQSIIAAEFQNHDPRFVPGQSGIQPDFAANRRLTGYARVDHPIIGMFARETGTQKVDPALVPWQAVAGGDAVAKYEYGRGGAGGAGDASKQDKKENSQHG